MEVAAGFGSWRANKVIDMKRETGKNKFIKETAYLKSKGKKPQKAGLKWVTEFRINVITRNEKLSSLHQKLYNSNNIDRIQIIYTFLSPGHPWSTAYDS